MITYNFILHWLSYRLHSDRFKYMLSDLYGNRFFMKLLQNDCFDVHFQNGDSVRTGARTVQVQMSAVQVSDMLQGSHK